MLRASAGALRQAIDRNTKADQGRGKRGRKVGADQNKKYPIENEGKRE